MSDEHQDRQRDIRDRIANQIQTAGPALKKPISPEDLEQLQAAASRLDQLLREAAEADHEALKIAAARLDQLLKNIANGKDVTNDLRRRRERQSRHD